MGASIDPDNQVATVVLCEHVNAEDLVTIIELRKIHRLADVEFAAAFHRQRAYATEGVTELGDSTWSGRW